ncbi:Acetylxylan esterase precursor [Pirellulimonas nuda]|uniref:Acetylxylan esterase n=1 Tax=Pirellulimonas nuda TaxID=2528009 RepID=A0A518DBX5_9BACT|nr:dienelactone hydrolase family protein [Pirellulimonas nuda]QDU88936.1 Acetylxylan esterase precursor [Pirellulimonas nuda]
MVSQHTTRSIVIWLSLASVATRAVAVEPTAKESPGAFGAARVIALYDGAAPGSEGWDYEEKIVQGRSGPQVRNVVRPTLLYFPAAKPVGAAMPAGAAMIVAPGGGNRTLMMGYEGVDIAKRLNASGIDAFVLKYRLKQTGDGADSAEPAALGPQAGQDVRALSAEDGRRAVELVRSRAEEFRLRPNRIGMIGFSAGGGPVRGAMSGDAGARPDIAALIYGAGRSGEKATAPDHAPPLFLAVAADDPNVEASIATFMAWRAADAPCELHVFQMGAHGFVDQGGGADHFMDRLVEWIQVNGWRP